MTTPQSHCATCTCYAASHRIPDALPELPASVNDLLLSNNPPFFDDIPILNAYRVSVDASVTRLNEDIESITALNENLQRLLHERTAILDQLKERRAALQERQQQLLGAVSIVRQLPLEVLQHILLMTTLGNESSLTEGFSLFDRNS